MGKLRHILRKLGRGLERAHATIEPLGDLRITVLLLFLLAVVLLFLDPGRDVVRSLVDNANSFISDRGFERGATSILLQWFAFWCACVWLGVNVWYWSAILYRSKRGLTQPGWFRFLRRFLGLAPLIIAMLSFWISSTRGLAEIWIGLLAFFVTMVIMFFLFVLHTRRADRRLRERHERSAEQGKPFRPMSEERSLGRGGVLFVSVSLIISALTMFLFCFPDVRTQIAWILGPAAIAFLAVACIVPATSLLVWLTRPYNIPVVAIGLIFAALFSFWNDNHDVRRLDGDVDRDARPTVRAAYDRWKSFHRSNDPVILVATAGGASRASYWTGTVLRALEDNDHARDFSRDVFAISSVSGGSLGAVGYAAWIADHQTDLGRPDPLPSLERRIFVQDFFGQDYLGPSVAGLLYPDLFQRFFPFGIFPSRADSLEESWEIGWDQAADRCVVEAERRKQPLICPRRGRMADDFLAIWGDALKPVPGKSASSWVPVVLVNGTHVETGKRILTAPVRITPDVFEDSYDFFDMRQARIRASTAVLNSARFPLVSPAGTIGRRGHIVDGGYFENGGLETILDLVRYLRSIDPERPIIIIEINNDDSLSAGDAARHQSATGNRVSLPVRQVDNIDGSPFLGEITSIVGGLYGTRSGRGVLGAKRASMAGNWLDDIGFFQFRLGRLLPGAHTTMSWAMSPSQRDRMDVVFNVGKEKIPELLDKRNYTKARRAAMIADLDAVLMSGSRNANVLELNALMRRLNGVAPARATATALSPGN